jgi:glycosyltransferase involved in cell wall biosynthesis
MKVSIVTVAYNAAKTIGDTIASVASQTYGDVEYIVVDGGSTDGTMDIVKQHRDKIAKFVSESDNGIYDAMNKGLGLATGDIVGFLNADDMYVGRGVIDRVVDAFLEPSVQACYGDLVYVDAVDTEAVVRYWKSNEYRSGLFARGWVPAHPTFFARRGVYEKWGRFDLRFKLAADFEIMARFLSKFGVKARYVPEVLVKMRMGGATNRTISNIVKQNIEIYRAAKKNGIRFSPFTFVLGRLLLRVPQFFAKPQWKADAS